MTRQLPEELRRLAQEVAAIVRECADKDAHVYWFGSWAWGNPSPRSDIDIGVIANEPLSPAVRGKLLDRIEELPTLRGIDVVDLRMARDELRERVVTEGIIL